jgi:enoyl-CoA hydratase
MEPRLQSALAEGVLTVTLTHGGANAIDQEMIDTLIDALGDAGERGEVRALVVGGGAGKIFCAGFDLVFLSTMKPEGMVEFLDDFSALYTALFAFPKPVVAALNGHAIAGGMLLALCADTRVAPRTGARFGVNEIDLGVPLPAGCIPLLEEAMGRARAARAALSGRLYPCDEALAVGLVDECADDPLARARALAAELGGKPAAAFAAMKAQLRGPVAERMAAADAQGHDAFVELWFSPEATERRARVLEGLRSRAGAKA